MLPNKLWQVLAVVVVISSCGSGYEYKPEPYSPPDTDFVAGAACQDVEDCGRRGFCGTWPGGYCTNGCTNSSECGTGGVCVTYDNGKQCAARCTPGTNSCRPGYHCSPFESSNGGSCYPGEEKTKQAIGGSCKASSECASNMCSTWPGGYCSDFCKSHDDCMTGSLCINKAINGNDACLVKCSNVGQQSSCRSGYTCVGLVGQSGGVCMSNTNGTSGAGGGSGGSGGSGGAGGGGGSGGGSNPQTGCRAYKTAYVEDITGPAGSAHYEHHVSFDRAQLSFTDVVTTPDGTFTTVTKYRTLADFIHVANPSVFMDLGGPSTIVTTGPGYRSTTTRSYDSQGRQVGASTMVTLDVVGTYEALRETYTAWDSHGRWTAGTYDLTFGGTNQRCIGQQATRTYDGVNYTSFISLSGGSGVCPWSNNTYDYDARLIDTKTIHQDASGTTNTLFNSATANVCF